MAIPNATSGPVVPATGTTGVNPTDNVPSAPPSLESAAAGATAAPGAANAALDFAQAAATIAATMQQEQASLQLLRSYDSMQSGAAAEKKANADYHHHELIKNDRSKAEKLIQARSMAEKKGAELLGLKNIEAGNKGTRNTPQALKSQSASASEKSTGAPAAGNKGAVGQPPTKALPSGNLTAKPAPARSAVQAKAAEVQRGAEEKKQEAAKPFERDPAANTRSEGERQKSTASKTASPAKEAPEQAKKPSVIHKGIAAKVGAEGTRKTEGVNAQDGREAKDSALMTAAGRAGTESSRATSSRSKQKNQERLEQDDRVSGVLGVDKEDERGAGESLAEPLFDLGRSPFQVFGDAVVDADAGKSDSPGVAQGDADDFWPPNFGVAGTVSPEDSLVQTAQEQDRDLRVLKRQIASLSDTSVSANPEVQKIVQQIESDTVRVANTRAAQGKPDAAASGRSAEANAGVSVDAIGDKFKEAIEALAKIQFEMNKELIAAINKERPYNPVAMRPVSPSGAEARNQEQFAKVFPRYQQFQNLSAGEIQSGTGQIIEPESMIAQAQQQEPTVIKRDSHPKNLPEWYDENSGTPA